MINYFLTDLDNRQKSLLVGHRLLQMELKDIDTNLIVKALKNYASTEKLSSTFIFHSPGIIQY